MKPKARYSARYGYAAPATLPPNLQTVGPLSFDDRDFKRLDAWLAEDGWPAERMDVATLEGYLTALLVWPIELSPGAWLPPIWGVHGWKVAAKIAAVDQYDDFTMLVIGYLQELDRQLATAPRRHTFALGSERTASGRYFAGSAWATGFMTALFQNSAGLQFRSVAARTAVEGIARYASRRSAEPSAMPAVAAALNASVAILLAERQSRGPLGILPVGRSANERRDARLGVARVA